MLRAWGALISVAMLVVMVSPKRVAAEPVTIVKVGKPAATIVIANEPTIAARLAAQELRYHLEEITGAVLPIARPGDPIHGVRILVGESKATRDIGLTSADFESQEYLIRATNATIVLMGRDWQDTPANRAETGRGMQFSLGHSRKTIQYNVAIGRPDAPTLELELPGLMDDQGTCYATYDFLERYCGVRWYGPSLINLVLPSQQTISVPQVDIRRKPSLLYRYAPGGGWPIIRKQWGHYRDGQKELFDRRMRFGGERWACNHSFASYRDRFLVKNNDHPELWEHYRPDFFAVGWENEGFWRQLCMTNPAVIAQVVQDARDYFDGKGVKGRQLAIGDYFSVVPEDSDHWCKCDRCQAVLEKGKSRDIKHTFGTGAASDYVFGFVNAVAKEIRKSHPDKFIATLAYHCYSYPPTFELEPNVAVAPCVQLCYSYWPGVFKSDAQFYREWLEENARSGRRLHVWNYFHHPMERAIIGEYHCFPLFMPDVIPEWVKRYPRDGVRGFYLCGIPPQLGYYIYMQTAFNAELDTEAMMDEFFAKYFGAAADPMKAFYLRIAEINREEGIIGTSEQASWETLGTQERMEELERLMSRAVAAAETELEKRRVDTWNRGIWEYMDEGRRTYVKIKRAREPKERTIAVYSTGMDDDRELLPDGAIDRHWRLVESGDGKRVGPLTYAVPTAKAPIPPWIEQGPESKSRWITPNPDDVNVSHGTYIYEQEFRIDDCMDLETVSLFGRVAADHDVVHMQINGAEVKAAGHFTTWVDFLITDHFVVGENSLRVVTANDGDAPNPHGLRVELEGFADLKK
jgi:hypothetical protein